MLQGLKSLRNVWICCSCWMQSVSFPFFNTPSEICRPLPQYFGYVDDLKSTYDDYLLLYNELLWYDKVFRKIKTAFS